MNHVLLAGRSSPKKSIAHLNYARYALRVTVSCKTSPSPHNAKLFQPARESVFCIISVPLPVLPPLCHARRALKKDTYAQAEAAPVPYILALAMGYPSFV